MKKIIKFKSLYILAAMMAAMFIFVGCGDDDGNEVDIEDSFEYVGYINFTDGLPSKVWAILVLVKEIESKWDILNLDTYSRDNYIAFSNGYKKNGKIGLRNDPSMQDPFNPNGTYTITLTLDGEDGLYVKNGVKFTNGEASFARSSMTNL